MCLKIEKEKKFIQYAAVTAIDFQLAQGAETPSNNKPNKGTLNMPKVYTAEIYLTIESAKEVFNKNQATRIINHEEW